MSFGPQEICRACGKINYEGRIVCNKCEEPWDPGDPREAREIERHDAYEQADIAKEDRT